LLLNGGDDRGNAGLLPYIEKSGKEEPLTAGDMPTIDGVLPRNEFDDADALCDELVFEEF
jgi:hypothetical protein